MSLSRKFCYWSKKIGFRRLLLPHRQKIVNILTKMWCQVSSPDTVLLLYIGCCQTRMSDTTLHNHFFRGGSPGWGVVLRYLVWVSNIGRSGACPPTKLCGGTSPPPTNRQIKLDRFSAEKEIIHTKQRRAKKTKIVMLNLFQHLAPFFNVIENQRHWIPNQVRNVRFSTFVNRGQSDFPDLTG